MKYNKSLRTKFNKISEAYWNKINIVSESDWVVKKYRHIWVNWNLISDYYISFDDIFSLSRKMKRCQYRKKVHWKLRDEAKEISANRPVHCSIRFDLRPAVKGCRMLKAFDIESPWHAYRITMAKWNAISLSIMSVISFLFPLYASVYIFIESYSSTAKSIPTTWLINLSQALAYRSWI